ncbi:MAG: hypothetical protein ACREQJ_01605 [Candidatus Binatia bacterium]
MSPASNATERILNALRPYASNWSGTLGRGDLVIPQSEIPKLVQEILRSVDEVLGLAGEVGDLEVFEALRENQRMVSLQDRVADLRRRFRVSKR